MTFYITYYHVNYISGIKINKHNKLITIKNCHKNIDKYAHTEYAVAYTLKIQLN